MESLDPLSQTAPGGDNVSSASSLMASFKALEAAPVAPVEVAKPAVETTQEQVAAPEVKPADTSGEVQPPDEPKQRAKWGELKTKAQERDELVEKKLPALEKQIAELTLKAEQVADTSRYDKQIAELTKEREALEKVVTVKAIEESPQFIKDIVVPMRKIGTDAAKYAAMYKINPTDLQQALHIVDPADQLARINELTADFDPIHKAKVWDLVESTQTHLQKAWEMQQNAGETKKELDFIAAEESKKSVAERAKQLQASSEAIRGKFKERAADIFTAEEFDKMFANVEVEPQDPTTKALLAHSLPVALQVIPKLRTALARVKELEGELAARASVTVKAGGGNGHQQVAVSTGMPEGGSLFERAKAMGVPIAAPSR